MILVDTSVWIDHIRSNDAQLTARIGREEALIHPFVVGELALGSLPDRQRTLRSFARLPKPIIASASEVVALIEWERLHGSGIGYVDAHLLASARITTGTLLWTRDGRLRSVAERLGIAADID